MNRISKLIAGGLLLILSLAYSASSVQYGLVTVIGAGAGLYPLLIGISLAFLSAMWMLDSFNSSDEYEETSWQTTLRKPFIILVVTLGAAFILETVGFFLTAAALLFFLMHIVERRSPVVSGLISIFGSGLIFLCFTMWLGVPLPAGLMGYW